MEECDWQKKNLRRNLADLNELHLVFEGIGGTLIEMKITGFFLVSFLLWS